MASTVRASRGEVGLVRLRSGYLAIRWGRRLARELGVAPIESTGTRAEDEARRLLRRRRVELTVSSSPAGTATLITERMETAVSAFLRAYAGGELVGRRPSKATVELAIHLLLGEERGLLPFAEANRRLDTRSLDAVFIMRWLEMRAVANAPDTVRIALNVAKRLGSFAFARGWISSDSDRAIRAIRPPPAARGRARGDGVPSEKEIGALLDALHPRREGAVPFDRIAELQLRLGLRRGEVIALDESWLFPDESCVRVPCNDAFRPKDRQGRTIDGVDALTFELASDVIALKRRFTITATGYRQAFRRACERLRAAGTPWRYRSKTQALRAAHATASRIAGVPLSVVALRLGHESERTTERHYVGRNGASVAGPFRDVPLQTIPRFCIAELHRGERRR